jgi:adenylate cyclase
VTAALWAALLAVAALAVAALVRSRRTIRGLEARLDAAAHSLEALQRAFTRFAPANVVEEIIAQGVSTRSEKKEITVLFADLKGFTPLAEGLDPALLVRVLNGYFERMSAAIHADQGHVAKLIGDGILALFGALETNPWQTNDAARAALAMRAALADYNRALARDGIPPLSLGIGIHRGPVVAGVIGSPELLEYGVIGSTVNLASRVERLTRVHAVDILVSEAARAALDPRFRLRVMPAADARGIATPVVTWTLEGLADEPRRR